MCSRIPAVYAIRDGQVVDGFVGAYPEHEVQRFVDSLLPTEAENEIAALVAAGDEASLRQALELEPGNEDAIVALGRAARRARRRRRGPRPAGAHPRVRAHAQGRRRRPPRVGADRRLRRQLAELLDRVKDDDDARQQFVDILELMGPDDPRTADYRRRLTARLF